MEDLNKIKERVAKLLAMAEDTSSPEEAAIAASRARKLMDKHQLEAWECQKDVQEPFCEARATRVYAAMPVYLDILSVAVAKFNDCQSIKQRDSMTYKMEAKRNQNGGAAPKSLGAYIEFRGYESDVQMAVAMLDKLVEAANNQCKTYLKPFGYDKYPVKVGTAFKQQFCHELTARLSAMTKERDELTFNDAATGTSTSLVVIKKASADEKYGAAEYQNVRLKGPKDAEADDAARAGRIAGQRQTIIEEIK